jgi:drug/metabolite transporter (DMT)-like permease
VSASALSDHTSRWAPAALVTAVVAVSWAAILIRVAEAPPLAIAFWRLALATLLLTPLAAWHGLGRRRAGRGPGGALITAAGALLAVHFGLWIASLFQTTVASSVMLVSTQPIFAAFLAGPLLGEPPSMRTWWATLLCVAGSALIAGGDFTFGMSALAGDLMALGAAGAAAVYLIIGRKARRSGPLPIYLWKVNGVAALVLLAGCLIGSAPLGGYPASSWAVFLGLAAGPHLAGHGLLNLAVRHLPAPAVNLSLTGEPILSSLYAVWLFEEWPPIWFYGGAAFILSGLVLEFAVPVSRRRLRR